MQDGDSTRRRQSDILRKGERTRQRILDATLELVESSGFGSFSIADITRRAGVTRPGFYFHFPTKAMAVACLMERLFDDFVTIASDWYEHRGADQATTLTEGLRETVEFWRRHASVMYAMTQAASVDEAARQVWDGWIARFVTEAVPTLEVDAADLLSRSQVSAQSLAETLVALAFDAMRRDVRSIVETGKPLTGLAETVTMVWERTVYGQQPTDLRLHRGG